MHRGFLAVIVAEFFLSVKGYNITLDPDGKVQVKDSKWAIINCVVTFDEGVDANKSEFNVTWMDENGEPVKVGGRDGDFQVADSNSAQNEKRIVLNVTGEVTSLDPTTASDFTKHFSCQLSNNGSVLDVKPVVVMTNVPLKLTPKQDPEDYFCFNDLVTLSCKFRSYPIPLSTSWSDTQGVLTEESKDFDEWTRTLYLLRATEPRTFTCFGSREDYDGINETEKHEFMIEVRDHQASYVTHANSGSNYCAVSWNNSDASHVTGYQITSWANGMSTTMEVAGNISQYQWKLVRGSTPTNVSVAMVMGRCVGPGVISVGHCTFTEEPPYEAILIGIGVSFGLIILILASYIGWTFLRRKQLQGDTTTKNHELTKLSEPNGRDTEADRIPMPPPNHPTASLQTFQSRVNENFHEEKDEDVYEDVVGGNELPPPPPRTKHPKMKYPDNKSQVPHQHIGRGHQPPSPAGKEANGNGIYDDTDNLDYEAPMRDTLTPPTRPSPKPPVRFENGENYINHGHGPFGRH